MINDDICLFNTEADPNDTSSSNCHLHQSLHHVDVSTGVGVDIVVVVGESSLLVVVRIVHVVPFSSSV